MSPHYPPKSEGIVFHMNSANCCDGITSAIDNGGGVWCLCFISNKVRVKNIGLNFTVLLNHYITCGGMNRVAIPEDPSSDCSSVASPDNERPGTGPLVPYPETPNMEISCARHTAPIFSVVHRPSSVLELFRF